MANSFKIRYLTNRERLNTFDKLHKDRHIYLGLNEAEPSLGYVGERPLPVGVTTFYSLVTIDNGTIYDRYWKELGLRIEDEGVPVGFGNNVNIINFVGAAITVIETSNNSVDIKVFAPGLDNQIIFNNNEELTAAPQFYYDSSTNKVGIGSTVPQQHLDIIGNLKISNNIYDSKNVVGSAGSVIVSTNGNGIVWGRGAPVSIGTIPHTGAVPGELWWNKRTGNLNVYYDDGNSQQWVDANSGFGVQGTRGVQGPPGGEPNYWNFGELGISTTKNVGIGTTNPTSKLSVIGDGNFTGVVTASSLFSNGPVLIGSGTSTGTASQRLQVTGGGYVSGKFGVGTTLPTSNVSIAGSFAAGIYADTFAVSNDGDGIVRAGSNIINGSVGTSRVNIQDRAGSLLSFYYSTGLIGRINVVNTTDLSVEVGGSERVRIHNSTGNVGVGTNNATEALTVYPKIQILNNSNADGRLIFRAKPGNAYRWNIDNDGDTNNLRFFKEDDANAANGAAPFQITPTGNATLTGNLNAAGNYYVKLARTSNQTINNGSDTLIGFSAISDGNSWFNSGNNRITPTVAGNYYISAMVKWEAGAAADTVQTNIQIRRNGSTVALSVLGTQTHTYTMNVSAIVTLNGSTDYIEFTAYTGNPTSQVIGGDASGTLTKLELFKIN